MKRNRKVVYFGAVVLVISLITASASVIVATSENFEEGVKVITIDDTPVSEALELTGTIESTPCSGVRAISVQITDSPEDEYEPAIGRDITGNFLLAYTFEEDPQSNLVPWRFSIDDGQTWDPGLTYIIEGIESHPAIDYRGSGKKFTGTLQGDPVEGDGAIQHTFMCEDVTNTDTYQMTYIEWASSYPYSNRLIPDICGYVLEEKPWWYGVIAVVGTRGSPGSVDMPIFNYADYEAEGSGWSSYFADYSGCENVAIDVDKTNGYFYAAFDYLDGSDWDILLKRGDCNGDGGSPDEHLLWFSDKMIGGVENTKYPAVGAHQDQVIILTQSDEAGTQDIVCYYSSDAGDTWESSVVADDDQNDELYPTIVSYGMWATATFIMDGDLYASFTEDGGATWSAPEQVNDQTGTVESEFRNQDITAGGNVVWTDNRAGNLDIYLENIGGEPPTPILEIGEITGGFGVSSVIKNTGNGDATNVNWTITVTGGILGFINKTATGTIASIVAGAEETIKLGILLGLGAIDITVTAECDEGASADATGTGTQIIIFTKVN